MKAERNIRLLSYSLPTRGTVFNHPSFQNPNFSRTTAHHHRPQVSQPCQRMAFVSHRVAHPSLPIRVLRPSLIYVGTKNITSQSFDPSLKHCMLSRDSKAHHRRRIALLLLLLSTSRNTKPTVPTSRDISYYLPIEDPRNHHISSLLQIQKCAGWRSPSSAQSLQATSPSSPPLYSSNTTTSYYAR